MLSEGVSQQHIEIMRGDLAKILYDAARHEVEYVFDHSIAKVEDDGTPVEVTFERGGRRTFELLVGADGLHSITRRLVFDSISQVVLDRWTRGRVALVGDARYCPGPAVGGGTSLAVIGACVSG